MATVIKPPSALVTVPPRRELPVTSTVPAETFVRPPFSVPFESAREPSFSTIPVPSIVALVIAPPAARVRVLVSRIRVAAPLMVIAVFAVNVPVPDSVPACQSNVPSTITSPAPPNSPPSRTRLPVAATVEAVATVSAPLLTLSTPFTVRAFRAVGVTRS